MRKDQIITTGFDKAREEKKMEKTKRLYWIAINAYRSSTSNGFANTWQTYALSSKKRRDEILTEGLPVSDCVLIDSNGYRQLAYSTMGIRLATRPEIRREKKIMYPLDIDQI